MPNERTIQLLRYLDTHPDSAVSVNWDKVKSLSPDLNLDKVRARYKIGEFQSAKTPDVSFDQPGFFEAMAGFENPPFPQPKSWTQPKTMPSEPIDLRISPHLKFLEPTENQEGNIAITGLNLAKNIGAMLADTPNFMLNELPELAVGSLTPGKPGFGDMIAGMAHDTGSLVALNAMKYINPEEYKRFTTKMPEGIEAQRVLNEEPLRPLMGPLIISGGGEITKRIMRGKRAIGETARAVRSPDIQMLPKLEGLEGEFAKVGGKTGKTYYRDPEQGWIDYHTKKPAKASLARHLDEQTSGLRGEGGIKPVPPPPVPTTLSKATQETQERMAGERAALDASPEPGRSLESPLAEQPAVSRETVELNKAEIAKIRDKYPEFAELPENKQVSWFESKRIADETGADRTAVRTAEEILKSKRQITQVEHAGMVKRYGELENEYEAALGDAERLYRAGNSIEGDAAMTRSKLIQADIEKIINANELGGSEMGRAFNFRKIQLNKSDYSIVHVQRVATIRKRRALTQEETLRFKTLTDRNKTLESRVKELESTEQGRLELREKRHAENITRRAINRLKIQSKAGRSLTKINAEETIIKNALRELGYRVNDITGVTAEGAYLIGRLTFAKIKRGATNFNQIVRLVKEDMPYLTDSDIYRSIISKDPARMNKARNDTIKWINQLKRQAKLLVDIENAEKGVFYRTEARPPELSEIAALKTKFRALKREAYSSDLDAAKMDRAIRTINELQDQLANHYRTVREVGSNITPQLAEMKTKIAELRQIMRTEDQLASLNEQLKTGEFVIKEKPVPKRVSQELTDAQTQVRIARKKIRAALDNMQPWTTRKVVGEGVNTLRTLKATADMSYTLRQGLILSPTRPVLAGKAFGKAFQGAFSQYKAEAIDNALRSRENYLVGERAGLELSELDGGMNLREEMFQANLIERVPILGSIVKASSRHMTTGLNVLRTGAFDQFLEKYPNATPAELKVWAQWINTATGRANLGKLAPFANEMSLVIFAPRFAYSRIYTPYMAAKAILGGGDYSPRIRKAIAKDMVGTIGLGMTALALAQLGGADVETSPRSPDYLKIRVGDTRIDIWGGLLQPARLVSRFGIGVTDKFNLTGGHLTKRQKNIDYKDVAERFVEYKLAPSATVPLELLEGKTSVGEPTTPSETMLRSMIPLVYQDLGDAWREHGPVGGLAVGGLNFLGVSTSTYNSWRRR